MPEAQPIEIIAFEDSAGSAPFSRWLAQLDLKTVARIEIHLGRVRVGNVSSAKSVGGGVSEFRLNFGPGYRIYFGRDGETLVILLGGGTKRRQQSDIQSAQKLWQMYKIEKRRRQ